MEHYLHVFTVPESKLLATNNHLAVFAISEEGHTVLGSKHSHTIFEMVYKALIHVVVQIDVAVVAIVQVKWQALNSAGLAKEELVFLVYKLVFRFIELRFIVETILAIIVVNGRSFTRFLRAGRI